MVVLFLLLLISANGYILRIESCYGVLTADDLLIFTENCLENISREVLILNNFNIDGFGIAKISPENNHDLHKFPILQERNFYPDEVLRFSEETHLIYCGNGDELTFYEDNIPLFINDRVNSEIVFIGFSKENSINFLPRIPPYSNQPESDEEHSLNSEVGLYATNFDDEDPCRIPTYTDLKDSVSIEFIALENTNFHCVWNVISPIQTTVEIKLKHINFPISENCEDSKITIYDGIDGFYPLLEVCSVTSTSFLLNGDAFRVEFSTIELANRMLPSFTIEIKEENETKELSNCGSKRIISEAAFVNSINFPKLYFPNTRCTWNFQFPTGEIPARRWIVLHFMNMNLEEKTRDHICKDKLQFYSYSERKENLLAIFCGDELSGKTLFFEFDEVILKFSADSVNEAAGFAAFVGFQKTIYPRNEDIVFR